MEPRERAEYIHGQISDAPMKPYMSHHELGADCRYFCDQANANGAVSKGRPWYYDHLLGGVQGWHAVDLAERDPLQLEDIIRIWGLSRWLVLQKAPGSRM